MAVHCVYWIRHADHTDLITQGYIGVTSSFDKRMKTHQKQNKNRHFSNAIKKYGWSNLIKEQILIADEDYCLNVESQLRPNNNIGWNLAKGGGKPPLAIGNTYKLGIPSWNKGVSPSDDTKVKISKSVSKLWEDPFYWQRMSNAAKRRPSPMKGKKHTLDTIERVRNAKIGVPSPKKGVPLTEEQKNAMINRVRQELWTCPHCKVSGMNFGAGNRWHFDNCKQKPVVTEIA